MTVLLIMPEDSHLLFLAFLSLMNSQEVGILFISSYRPR